MRYKIPSQALSITLNALGDHNRILASVVSRAAVKAYDGENIGYGPDFDYQRWPLTAYPTQFSDDRDKYVHIAIPRSVTVGREAVVVFPSYELDTQGYANVPTGSTDDDGNIITERRRIGSSDYWYIYLQGIILAPVNGVRRWQDETHPFYEGDLDTNAAYDAGPIETDWYRYDAHADVDGRTGMVTFKRDIDLLRNDTGKPAIGFRIMRIGDAVMRWDKDKNAIILEHMDGDTKVHLAATGDLCAFGFSEGGGGGGGGGSTVEWQQIYKDVNNRIQIATITIDGVSTPVYAPRSGGGGGTGTSWADIAPEWVAPYVDAAPPVSTFTNDTGYITANALNGYATQTWVNDKMNPLLAVTEIKDAYGNFRYLKGIINDKTLAEKAAGKYIEWYDSDAGRYNMTFGRIGVNADLKDDYALAVGGAAYVSGDADINGNAQVNGFLRIGNARLRWDDTNKALMLEHVTSGRKAHFAASGDVCAFGFSEGGGGGTGGGGTLSSVALSMPPAFEVSNSPLTQDGTITVSLRNIYTIPTTSVMENLTNKANQGATAYGWGDHRSQGYAKETWVIANYAPKSHKHPFSDITNRPTTLEGYGITDAFQLSKDKDSTSEYVKVSFRDAALTNLAINQCLQWYAGYSDEGTWRSGWVNMSMGRLGVKCDPCKDAYKNYALSVEGNTFMNGSLRIGDAYLAYDSSINGLRLYRQTAQGIQQACHLVASGDVAAYNALGAFSDLKSLTLTDGLNIGEAVIRAVRNDADEEDLIFRPSGNMVVDGDFRVTNMSTDFMNADKASLSELSLGAASDKLQRIALTAVSGSVVLSTTQYLYLTISGNRYRITMQKMT